jgi:dipeptidyl aminopeptidase/acylaminoacyl peptidase
MRKSTCLTSLLLAATVLLQAQPVLTVEKIMRDPKWIGSSPSGPFWSYDSKYLYFNWNPDNAYSDSLYFIIRDDLHPHKTTYGQRQALRDARDISWNKARTAFVFENDGDIFMTDGKTGQERRITQTTERESGPQFSFNDTRIVYVRAQNLYAWDIATGLTIQLSNFQPGAAAPVAITPAAGLQRGAGRGGATGGGARGPQPEPPNTAGIQENWLKKDQLRNFDVLRSRKEKRDTAAAMVKALPKKTTLRTISIEDKNLSALTISPDGRFISWRLVKTATGKNTIVPSYVTESGFTEDIPGRTKVGAPQGTQEYFVFDTEKDTVFAIKPDTAVLPGLTELPAYLADYPKIKEEKSRRPQPRALIFQPLSWSPAGTHAIADIRSEDNKDRWIASLDAATGKLHLLDRQHDDAWIGGPGIGGGFGGGNQGWIDDNTFWYQSEATGYSHLYTVNVTTGEKKALDSGRYEVQQAALSADKKYFYISTNEAHPGEQQFYRLPLSGGKAARITTQTGSNQVSVSPDGKTIAYLYSYSNKPWELYLQENKPGSKPQQVTHLAASDEFKAYPWREPEVISFTARDGATVYARLYQPAHPHASHPAVIFVHGAGYLQNAHKWWSSYFREYMFNNFLADNGYTVMDIDYRGSAGYGRNWRTGIYRYMGGKDLTDHVDAAAWMVNKLGVNPKHIGLYGGSYGGFITLMAMFTTPDSFAAGAALRPVTDWANYNHGYTSNILNEPFTDSIAYRRSSPYYFADGLKGHLLICHGMIDTNVNFQDAVKLTQRLIELGKDNWQLAPYPMEDHGFVEPSSWTDEYKRIFKLFESNLK